MLALSKKMHDLGCDRFGPDVGHTLTFQHKNSWITAARHRCTPFWKNRILVLAANACQADSDQAKIPGAPAGAFSSSRASSSTSS